MQEHNTIYVVGKERMIDLRHRVKGFSLLEVLLVLAIMATVMVSLLSYTTHKSDEMRRDRTVMQVEQILNAGLAYYVNLGSWPTALTQLQPNFLPSGAIINSWGQVPSVGAPAVSPSNPGALFYVCTTITGQQAFTAATTIAGRLPIASAIDGTVASCQPPAAPTACSATSTSCTVISSVNIPGQNINNARSINFAGLYHNGACVAAPVCPLNMVQSIVVAPVSVSGMYDNNSTNVYPISSFTAYAIGTSLSATNSPPGASPYNCEGTATQSCGLTANGTYWRVCLRIVTQKGLVSRGNGNLNWAQNAGIILALTRCMPPNEPTLPEVSGDAFTVFRND